MATQIQKNPPVSWDGKKFIIFLNDKQAEWSPNLTYVIRIREVGTQNWSFGFETPLTKCGFVDLKPNTEYEAEVRAKNTAGEGPPAHLKFQTARLKFRTDLEGSGVSGETFY